MPIPNSKGLYDIDNEVFEKMGAQARSEAIANNQESFASAFAKARRARLAGNGGDVFNYNNKKYLSYQQDDLNAMDAGKFSQLQNNYKWITQTQKELAGNASNAKQENVDNVNANSDKVYTTGDASSLDTGQTVNAYGLGNQRATGKTEDTSFDLIDALGIGGAVAGIGALGRAGWKYGMKKIMGEGIEGALPKVANVGLMDDLGKAVVSQERQAYSQADELKRLLAEGEKVKQMGIARDAGNVAPTKLIGSGTTPKQIPQITSGGYSDISQIAGAWSKMPDATNTQTLQKATDALMNMAKSGDKEAMDKLVKLLSYIDQKVPKHKLGREAKAFADDFVSSMKQTQGLLEGVPTPKMLGAYNEPIEEGLKMLHAGKAVKNVTLQDLIKKMEFQKLMNVDYPNRQRYLDDMGIF